ncbi:MAG: hypothetical protein ABI895_00480 [Deltaproteobacteria bacterium]
MSPAIGLLDATAEQLGGWTFSAHHIYDARSQVVYLGDGTTRRMAAQGPAIVTGVGNTTDTNTDPLLGDVGPDGRIYFSDGKRVQSAKNGVVYDADGKVDFIQTPEGPLNYTYFTSSACPGCSLGAISSISDPGGVNLSFTYDGPLTTSSAWSGAVSGAISWNYDSDFRVRSETVSAGTTSQSAVFAYDADSLLVCASPTTCSPASADALVIQNDFAQPRRNGSTLGIVSDHYDYNAYGELAGYSVLAGSTTIFSEIMDTAAHPRDPLGRVAFEAEFNGSTTSAYE